MEQDELAAALHLKDLITQHWLTYGQRSIVNALVGSLETVSRQKGEIGTVDLTAISFASRFLSDAADRLFPGNKCYVKQ